MAYIPFLEIPCDEETICKYCGAITEYDNMIWLNGKCMCPSCYKREKEKERKRQLQITQEDAARIKDDAQTAIYALEGLVAAAPYIHKNYLHEKLEVVRRCIKFMEYFEGSED